MSVVNKRGLGRYAVRSRQGLHFPLDLRFDFPVDFPFALDFHKPERTACLQKEVDLHAWLSPCALGSPAAEGAGGGYQGSRQVHERQEIAVVVDDHVLKRKAHAGVDAVKFAERGDLERSFVNYRLVGFDELDRLTVVTKNDIISNKDTIGRMRDDTNVWRQGY